MSLPETNYTLDGVEYVIKKLPLEASQEVLVRRLKLLGGDVDENALASIPSRVSVADITFLREKLLGPNCPYINEAGNEVPLGKAIVNSHFEGHIGKLLHILGKCLVINYSDFLADLRLEELVAEVSPA